MNKYIPHTPTAKQQIFLCLDHIDEVLYGGAGGGGKSDALLMAALQYVDVPGYAALILRRSFAELDKPGALMTRAHEWLAGTDARWMGAKHKYVFPSGAQLQFGHLENEKAKFDYGSAEFQTICIDELTEFYEPEYTFMFSRLRRNKGVTIPVRMRGATNPGGPGHMFVKRRFIDKHTDPTRIYIPAWLQDNPFIDQEAYIKALMKLSPLERARILTGNWEVAEGGGVFDRSWFTKILGAIPAGALKTVRSWDLAASKKGKRTAGVKMSKHPSGLYVVEHVVKGQWLPGERDEVIKTTAKTDGKALTVLIEQEGGSGGVAQNDSLIKLLVGHTVESIPASGSGNKFVRAGPFATQASAGNVALVDGPWVSEYIDEMHHAQEKAEFLDQMDASTMAFNYLVGNEDVEVPAEYLQMIQATQGRMFPTLPNRIFS